MEKDINYLWLKRIVLKKKFDLKEYGVNLASQDNKIFVDTLKWNGKAKKDGLETGDYITEFKIENLDRPRKALVYPVAILFLIIFGYLNYRRKDQINLQDLSRKV